MFDQVDLRHQLSPPSAWFLPRFQRIRELQGLVDIHGHQTRALNIFPTNTDWLDARHSFFFFFFYCPDMFLTSPLPASLLPDWHNSETNELLWFVFVFILFCLERHPVVKMEAFSNVFLLSQFWGPLKVNEEKVCPLPLSFPCHEFTFNFRKGLFSQIGTLYHLRFLNVFGDF